MHQLKVKRLHPEAKMPAYATDGSGCFDLHAFGEEWGINQKAYGIEVTDLRPTTFRTGLSFEIPPGFVMLVFSRSGHGFKSSVRLANCVGVIDSDYRGEVQVKLTADTGGNLKVYPGDRIAQAMLIPAPVWELIEVDELTATERGEGGFGSTGN